LPLSERARIEVYLPDLPKPAYRNLLELLDQELTYAFGGCTVVQGLSGSYLSRLGQKVQDRINVIYTDTPFTFEKHFRSLSRYLDELRAAVFVALEEEAVLVVALKVCHTT
jgi:type VI protein secretion system component VasF